MENLQQSTIGSIVADNYKTASVFRKYGIDFCCKGNRTIGEASAAKGLDTGRIEQELKAVLADTGKSGGDYQTWPLDLLADYIEKIHHAYVLRTTPVLRAYLEKINAVHGARHPELTEILQLFVASTDELMRHMQKEEQVLFPQIRRLVEAQRKGEQEVTTTGIVQNAVAAMMQEHEQEGTRFARISELSQGYTPPEDACATYKVAFATLQEFELDLHNHIHLENNILFPKAIALESELRQPSSCTLPLSA